MPQIAIIPDIHADPQRLGASLECAGQSSKFAFLGDFIDAGAAVRRPDDQAVLTRVRDLCDAGRAVAIMGNHELNAILFHRRGSDGAPLRAHSEKNLRQHRSFCDSFGIGTPAALEWTEWFLTLPLWRDLGGLRLVHAFWGDAAIATIAARRPDGRLQPEDLPEVAAKETPFARAVNLILTGPELALPSGVTFRDYAGHPRSEVRIAWWRSDAPTWRKAALSVPDPSDLPDDPIIAMPDLAFYGAENSPVLVGHYKMTGTPEITAPQAACLDYPDAPCLYLWQGEGTLDARHLVRVST